MEIIITESNNSTYGSYYISYDLYTKIYEYYEYKIMTCKNYSRNVYTLGNKKMIIEDNNTQFIEESNIKCKVMNNLIIRIYDAKKIDSTKFPIIQKYDSVTKSNVTEFIFKNFIINFIVENNNYYVVLKTNNKDTIDIKNTVSFILEELV